MADAHQNRPADLVDREFTADRPDQLLVADLTYVATWAGVVYVAFVIDVFSRAVVRWRRNRVLQTNLLAAVLRRRFGRSGSDESGSQIAS